MCPVFKYVYIDILVFGSPFYSFKLFRYHINVRAKDSSKMEFSKEDNLN